MVPSTVQVYEAGLHDTRLWVVDESGRRRRVPVGQWRQEARGGDESLLDRCTGPTLDVGCGPGRMTVALLRRSVPALGIDISPSAVRMARTRGAAAVQCSVFEPVPGAPRWSVALLADGNVGIGGDPVRLLCRLRQLVRRDGLVLVETGRPGTPSRVDRLRLQDAAGRTSAVFAWASLSFDDVAAVAHAAGLSVSQSWTSDRRWFAALRAN